MKNRLAIASELLRIARELVVAGRLTTEEFVEKARKVHGDKYDYSETKYVNQNEKVTIICPIHGPFEQVPYNHLAGHGCPKCGGRVKSNTEEFIEKARKIYGDKYDYSKVEYDGIFKPVTIICPLPGHGEFQTIPKKFLRGNAVPCPKCQHRGKPGLTTEEFIEKARKVHGDKYDYSKVDYVDTKTNVTIICPVDGHGEFQQLPSAHLNGSGCPRCFGNKKLDTEEFIEKARKVHGDKYDYSAVDYVNAGTKVTIICPIHGPFQQRANEHLSGRGCRYCAWNVRDNGRY